MRVYLEVIKYNFLRFLTYPTEILATGFRRAMEITFIVAFWVIITGKGISEVKPLLSYFLIAQSVALLVMARRIEFGQTLRRTIKYGTLNNYLTKPINVIAYLYTTTIGNQGLSIILALTLIVAGLIINPPTSFFNLITFILMVGLSACIAFSFNLMEGVYAFYITETGPISSSTRRVIEIFGGALAPLSYYPEKIRNILELSPFPSMVFGPTNALTNGLSLKTLLISIFWAILLNIIVLNLWRIALKKYEAIGA